MQLAELMRVSFGNEGNISSSNIADMIQTSRLVEMSVVLWYLLSLPTQGIVRYFCIGNKNIVLRVINVIQIKSMWCVSYLQLLSNHRQDNCMWLYIACPIYCMYHHTVANYFFMIVKYIYLLSWQNWVPKLFLSCLKFSRYV